MTVPVISCINCKNLYPTKERACLAFPAGIPSEILTGENDHTREVEGDNGIRFDKIKEDGNAREI